MRSGDKLKRVRGVRLIGLLGLAMCSVFITRAVARANPSGKHQGAQPQAGAANSQNPSADQTESITERTQRRGSQLLILQTQEEADAKTLGCMSSGCHNPIDSTTMHAPGTVRLGCTDCHGGDASVMNSAAKDSSQYNEAKNRAHVRARFREDEHSAANPVRSYFGSRWLKESAERVKFVNPSDNRVSQETCGRSGCHSEEVHQVRTSMMTHGAMLWGAALYNNGGYPIKNPRFGESYGRDGKPQRLITWPPPTPEETKQKGILPYIDPLQRWEISQPGNVLRVFERGGREKGEVGNRSEEHTSELQSRFDLVCRLLLEKKKKKKKKKNKNKLFKKCITKKAKYDITRKQKSQASCNNKATQEYQVTQLKVTAQTYVSVKY